MLSINATCSKRQHNANLIYRCHCNVSFVIIILNVSKTSSDCVLDKNIPDSLKCCLGIELKNSIFYPYRVETVVNVAVVDVVWRHVLKMISLIQESLANANVKRATAVHV